MVKLPGDTLAEARFLISNKTPLLEIGLNRDSLLSSDVYVVLELYRAPRLSEFRKLRRLVTKHFRDYKFYCQTNSSEGRRFAEFFGFKFTERRLSRDVLVLEA